MIITQINSENFSINWIEYKNELNLTFNYLKDEIISYQKWQNNLENIKILNQNSSQSHKYGLTLFTHLSEEEYQTKILLNFTNTSQIQVNKNRSLLRGSFNDYVWYMFNKLPSSWSWVDQGFVTSVKYQANCGSCYAFATVYKFIINLNLIKIQLLFKIKAAAIETVYAIDQNIKPPIDFSEQQIIDCSNYLTVNKKYKPNQGCNGGLPTSTLQYAIDYGLEASADYP
jgi:cathepsin L